MTENELSEFVESDLLQERVREICRTDDACLYVCSDYDPTSEDRVVSTIKLDLKCTGRTDGIDGKHTYVMCVIDWQNGSMKFYDHAQIMVDNLGDDMGKLGDMLAVSANKIMQDDYGYSTADMADAMAQVLHAAGTFNYPVHHAEPIVHANPRRKKLATSDHIDPKPVVKPDVADLYRMAFKAFAALDHAAAYEWLRDTAPTRVAKTVSLELLAGRRFNNWDGSIDFSLFGVSDWQVAVHDAIILEIDKYVSSGAAGRTTIDLPMICIDLSPERVQIMYVMDRSHAEIRYVMDRSHAEIKDVKNDE